MTAAEALLDLFVDHAPAADVALDRLTSKVVHGPLFNGAEPLNALTGQRHDAQIARFENLMSSERFEGWIAHCWIGHTTCCGCAADRGRKRLQPSAPRSC